MNRHFDKAMTQHQHLQTDYASDNVFAKILRGDLPCRKIYEDQWALAFHDINPRATTHALVIPKGSYISSQDFHAQASDDEIVGYYRAIDKTLDILDLKKQGGFRLLSNSGVNAHQEVPHFHTHIFAGQDLGPMLCVSREQP